MFGLRKIKVRGGAIAQAKAHACSCSISTAMVTSSRSRLYIEVDSGYCEQMAILHGPLQ
jgi:hypothetical protein